jgi:hypothetical protein
VRSADEAISSSKTRKESAMAAQRQHCRSLLIVVGILGVSLLTACGSSGADATPTLGS